LDQWLFVRRNAITELEELARGEDGENGVRSEVDGEVERVERNCFIEKSI